MATMAGWVGRWLLVGGWGPDWGEGKYLDAGKSVNIEEESNKGCIQKNTNIVCASKEEDCYILSLKMLFPP